MNPEVLERLAKAIERLAAAHESIARAGIRVSLDIEYDNAPIEVILHQPKKGKSDE